MLHLRKTREYIKAHQWFKNGDHPDDYLQPRFGFENGELVEFSGDHARSNDWSGAVVGRFRRPDVSGEAVCYQCGYCMNDHGWIDSGGEGDTVCPGDWVISVESGGYYPCKPGLMQALFGNPQKPVA
jgi:hypothetical protein